MEYGKALRFHRVKQGLTQNQLADGIISAAYLSKIENDQTVPAIEVLELLYERLGIDFNESALDHPSKEKLKEWYEAIVFKRKDEAKLLRDELLQQKNSLGSHQLYIFYELFSIRYLLLENEVEEAYETWGNLRQHKDTFDDEMEFYYHLITGLVKYYQAHFNEAFQELMEAKNYSSSTELEGWEVSDLYYLLALSTSQANHTSASVFYADQALEIFQSHYDLTKSADCHIVQGINYSRLKNFAKSLENFHLARKIALQTNNNVQLRLVYLNIGTLESGLENHQSAINNYKNSLEYNKESTSTFDHMELLTTIHSLVIENYKLGDYSGCLKWIDIGEEKLRNFPAQAYEYHFIFYRKVINQENDLIEFVEADVIPYFQSKKEHIYIIRYSMFLADQLEKQRMYKKSSSYLRLAIQLLNKHSQLGGILL
ncbi:helix-turn-helix domain-containing protein [Halobacillus sp. A1]|uniref:helix-turn-helix domain-containing protein n=1 Tax=Halobacillus sp. A1 TaxID=2880262 RepID=UPI0020A6B3AE|nr:helix-turn-helix transcriptional regulator [Halobacillus sp. A1]MCP3031001.1 helix-turn-helix domain-containing protein [Halobacillus sp. A1]